MKKERLGSRLLSLLLVAVMVVSMLPVGALAVTGDIVVGDTGVDNDTIGDQGSINWPVKIYDYLNDGMLFEPATANRTTGDTSSDSVLGGWYGLYGGGQNMPETVQGTDFTGNSAHYGSGAIASITTTTPSYTLTKVEAEHYVSPQYMRLEKQGTADGNSMCLVNFTLSATARYTPGGYQKCLPYDDVRYMVLVYKGQGIDSDDNVQVWLESYSNATLNSSGLLEYSGSWSYVTVDIDIPDSEGWSALVVDLATVDPELYMSDGTATQWTDWNACTATYLRLPGIDTGDVLDISHVAFFGTQGEAERYGERAVAFDNDPGECLLKDRTITWTTGGDGEETTETMPVVDTAPDFNLGYDATTVNSLPTWDGTDPSSATAYKYRMGMNFTNIGSGGYSSATYATWENPSSITLYSGTGTSSYTTYTPTKQTVQEIDDGDRDYVRITNSSSGSFLLSTFREGSVAGVAYTHMNYAVVVYRTNGFSTGEKYGFWGAGYKGAGTGYGTSGATHYYACLDKTTGWSTNSSVYKHEFQVSSDLWVYDLIPLYTEMTAADGDYASIFYTKYMGMYVPALTGGKSLDIAYVAYFLSEAAAKDFADDATGYMNSGKTYTTTDPTVQTHTVTFPAGRSWNSGNNLSFGLYHGSQGGEWTDGANGGLNSHASNGYYSYRIGYDTTSSSTANSNQKRKPFGLDEELLDAYYTASDSNAPVVPTTGKTNQIFYTTAASNDGTTNAGYSTSHLPLDGYSLYTTLTSGGMTVGLLEGTTKDGRPVYRQETVEYVAELLYDTLTIPQFDATGNYNYNFVSGTASDQFATDLNGDGDMVDMIDTNGDQVPETSEAAMDLASALRYELGIEFTLESDRGTAPTYGDYATTSGKALLGSFESCRGSIDTCMDAAWFLLNNLFVDGSYNQVQDDFSYLTLSYATLDEVDENGVNKTAYVFDAGYATAVDGYTEGTQISYLDADQYTSTSAVDYNYYGKTDDAGNVIGDGTISLMDDQLGAKDLWCYLNENKTTRFPFLPVVDAEDEYAGEIRSPYFRDDGSQSVSADKATYVDRNYNYVMASNGEFVYYEDDDLFFEFEGDDDVYLFLNGQLVLDIGGAHSITAVKFKVNDYVQWARALKADADAYGALTEAEQARVEALALVEGQICSFDFYYMERHGYGANCRIVTNMHVTDPSLSVEKNASQFGEKVEYGGAVDGSSPIGYEFKVTNTGNTKLYNLTFTDDIIGVTLDPENGLTVKTGMNGSHVRDTNGGTLEATDLSAVVTGTNAEGVTTTVNVTFNSNEELKSFLKSLQADGTESGLEDAEITNSGSGLWVGASVSIKGMYYVMTLEQVDNGGMENIVYVTATTKIKTTDSGNETLRSDAKHRVYTSGAPVYYQWAEHELFLQHQEMVTDSIVESVDPDSQLNKYFEFFDKIDITNDSGVVTGADLSKVHITMCDKYGNPVSTEGAVTDGTDADGNAGYYIDYPNAGTYSFHVLVHLNASNGGYEAGTKASAMAENTFAIIRVTVYVADVADSVFVLDYGLRTESLDAGGELFKDDELFGSSGTMQAKLMGVSTTEPAYLSAKDGYSGKYDRIAFTSLAAEDMKKISFADGYFNMNVAIGSDGKEISYDASTGGYSLTEVGTVRLNADVPSDWTDVRAYYWYDNGANNGWPGTPMTKVDEGGSSYYLDIPADVGYVIINNGNDDQKTDDLEITPGVESSITVSARPEGDTYYPAVVSNVVKYANAYVSVPDSWGAVYLYCWRDNGEQIADWPGVAMTKGDDGKYTGQIPSETSYVIVNDGGSNQTDDLDVLAGKEVWITLDSESYGTRDDGKNMYTATMAYNQSSYTVHAKVPDSWGAAYLHYWLTGTSDGATQWPGVAMTKGTDGWYSAEVPAGVSYMVVNCGDTSTEEGAQVPYQTVDLTVNAGLEAWITVEPNWDYQSNGTGFYKANVAYGADGEEAGFTFTPTDFLETESTLWLALTVHTTGKVPSPLRDADTAGTIDINNEVQMFKKVTVVPASVIYYEDDFEGIDYANDAGGSFQRHGEGSGTLTQSVDQDVPYGQDPTYQAPDNSLYSGDSMTEFLVDGYDPLAEFTFTGTGFELIGRTDASKSGIIVVEVFQGSESIQYFPVINEFDNCANGGEEGIYQVPVIRVKDLQAGQYRVVISGNPTYDFDKWEAEGGDIEDYLVDTRLYIDGLRIYQPIAGGVHEAYSDTENGAEFLELRDLITNGTVAVGDMTSGSLSLSSGTMTWTENLLGDDFESDSQVYVGNQVSSTEDYLIQGPNNEVYMEGSVSNSALVFYVSEDGSPVHELQLAIRALDYQMFFGTGYSALNAPIQYGVQLADGSYAWKPLVTVQSGTEQYYSIPYTECPLVDGKYQVVIRANGTEGTLAMASYSSLKLVGLDLMKVDGVGEDTILYYENGILVNWLLWGKINGADYGVGDEVSYYRFKNGKLTVTFTEDSYVALKTSTNVAYMIDGGDISDETSATMVKAEGLDTAGKLFVPGGKEVTFTLTQDSSGNMVLSYCAHSYDAGVVTQAGSCTQDEHILYTCEQCGVEKTQITEATGHEMDEGQQTQDPTCTEDGVFTYTCTICGEEMTHPIGALGHSMDEGTQTTAPGCETEGVFTYTCTVCGHTETEAIPATGHTMEVGGICSVCGQEVCDHQWDSGTVTSENGCETTGLQVFTCGLCGAVKEETLAALGHDLVDGSCTRCDYTTVRTVYFRNSYNWSDVHIYTWTGGTQYTGAWPGATMTLVEGTTNLYRYNVPLDAANVIFYNSDTNRTGDLTIDTSGNELYSCAAGKWMDYVEPVLSREYSLVGYINGADYGCNDDYQNVGDYVFNGKTLTVTFQEDSYVFLKTTNNSDWYMVPQYVSGSSGTFQNTSTGAGEKMFVPGGVAVTFTLVENSDGTLTLSYTTAGTASLDAQQSSASVAALNLSAIEKQMSATYVVGAAVSEETVEQPEVDTVVQPTLELSYGSLSFESEILYNIYYSASDLDDVVEMGLVTFDSQLTDGTIADAADVIPGYVTDGTLYMVATDGIAAKNMGDDLWFKVYAKLSDGTYVYTGINSYSAVRYAQTILGRETSSSYMKALVVAMLNYGAEAQLFFGYHTDSLMNAGLTAEQLALNSAYDETMVADIVTVDETKATNFVFTSSAFTSRYPSVSFDGAFSINFYFTAANAPDNGMTFYYWDLETYDSVDVLTKDNATGTMEMTVAGTNKYYGVIEGIAAKEMDETVFVAGVYEVDGVEYTTGVIPYSLGRYCETVAAKDTSDQRSFAQATAVYGYYAKEYFANL